MTEYMGKVSERDKVESTRRDVEHSDPEVYEFSNAARKSISTGQFKDVIEEMDKLERRGKDRNILISAVQPYAIRVFAAAVRNFLQGNSPQSIALEMEKYLSIGIDRKALEEVINNPDKRAVKFK